MLTWDHNLHYHRVILRAVPEGCASALDIGCGQGAFASKVALRSGSVIGVDRSEEMITRARRENQSPGIEYLTADFMQLDFHPQSFDFISALAVLHHLPLDEAVAKVKDLLRPGGTFAVLGLYKERPAELPLSLMAMYVNRIHVRIKKPDAQMVTAPTSPPEMTLPEIKSATAKLLPGRRIRRHLLWRYSMTWSKPDQ